MSATPAVDIVMSLAQRVREDALRVRALPTPSDHQRDAHTRIVQHLGWHADELELQASRLGALEQEVPA